MARPVLRIIICSTRRGRVGPSGQRLDEDRRFKPTELVEASASAVLGEVLKWTESLAPLREG